MQCNHLHERLHCRLHPPKALAGIWVGAMDFGGSCNFVFIENSLKKILQWGQKKV
jgi:hypothetical protein